MVKYCGMKTRIAVVGAGIYGVSLAVELAKVFDVTLFERLPDILMGVSGSSQARIHHGYHYPRAPKTRTMVQRTRQSFIQTYPGSIMEHESYYCIAKDSQTSPEAFLTVCREERLRTEAVTLPYINTTMIDLTVRVDEDDFDITLLRGTCWERLNSSNVCVKLSTNFTAGDFNEYDHTVLCTYGNMNELLPQTYRRQFTFKLCEKIVVRLPSIYNHKSIAVFDGPYFTITPYGKTPETVGLHLFGAFDHATHHQNVGYFSTHPARYNALLNKGLIANPPITNFNKFVALASQYLHPFEPVEHIGSMFAIKTLLPGLEASDERPTLFEFVDDRLSYVFGSKIANCVETAREVRSALQQKRL
jgi:hypothetical protein